MENLYKQVTDIFSHNNDPAHDIKHVTRTAALARYIAVGENYDADEAEIAGLLHDMGRIVQNEAGGHGIAGVPLARQLLDEYTDYDETTKTRILLAVQHHCDLRPDGKLTHIVQDADMLDGLGAVGIMRAYTTLAHAPDYDPDNIIAKIGIDERNIKNAHEEIAFQMNWLQLIHTPTARKIAEKRHAFMVKFLEEFQGEVQRSDC